MILPALVSTIALASATLDTVYKDTLKSGSELTDPPALPEKSLGLMPAEEEQNESKPRCGRDLSAAPLVVGGRDQYAKLGGLVKGAAMGFLGKALANATGGALQPASSEKEEPQPAMYEDPIKKKFRKRFKDKTTGTRLNMGGQMKSDGLVLSTRLDGAEDKGTFHEVYLEREDCRRIYPFADYTYELWGKWKLTVSWTKTTSTYRDGKLVDQKTSSGGFSREGKNTLLASGAGSLPLSDALAKVPAEMRAGIGKYQAMLRDEGGPPMWQRLGFGAPTSGARAVGNLFKLSQADLEAISAGRMNAVVQVTRERGPFYEAVGVPVALSAAGDGYLSFAPAEADPPDADED